MAPSTCAHQVQFYDAHDALGTNVASFLAVPLLRGEAALVVATPEHRTAFATQLEAAGIDLDAVRTEGRYVELDGAETLAGFTTDTGPGHERFHAQVGGMVADLAARFGAVSAYGEMVGLLAADGHLVAALELEALWSATMEELPLRMLCGYPRELFEDPVAQQDLDSVCSAHDGVAPTVVSTAAVDLPAGPEAGAIARRAVADVCMSWGLDSEDWTDDAVLVVAELVGNAVRHAGSRSALSLDAHGGTVTISVTDGSDALPLPRSGPQFAEDGRGFVIIDALADRWGVETRPSGKRVWAQLPPCAGEAWRRTDGLRTPDPARRVA